MAASIHDTKGSNRRQSVLVQVKLTQSCDPESCYSGSKNEFNRQLSEKLSKVTKERIVTSNKQRNSPSKERVSLKFKRTSARVIVHKKVVRVINCIGSEKKKIKLLNTAILKKHSISYRKKELMEQKKQKCNGEITRKQDESRIKVTKIKLTSSVTVSHPSSPPPHQDDVAPRILRTEDSLTNILREPSTVRMLRPLQEHLLAIVRRKDRLHKLLHIEYGSKVPPNQQFVHINLDPSVTFLGTTMSQLRTCFNARLVMSKKGL